MQISLWLTSKRNSFIHSLIRNATTLYLRYIDDIILIWTKSDIELLTSFEKLNQQHPSINFDMKHSKDKIEFLDTLIYKDKNNNIQTTLYKNLQTTKSIYTQNQPTLIAKHYV